MPDLQSELNKIKPRKAPNRETVEPVYVKKLVDILGSTETARRIGYTQSGIQTAIRQRNEIGKTAEIAAELVYREMQRAVEVQFNRHAEAFDGPRG